jgi:hypothetical protein
MIKKLRIWIGSVESFFLEVILGERRGAVARLVGALLFFCGRVFHFSVKLRRWL